MFDNSNYQNEQHRGKRALEFLRVSTVEQEKSFGWPRQHATNQQKLIEPLDLRVIDTIKDSYTGLEFQERAALDEALLRAKKREYDLLIVDMLDRLGRKGLEREIYMLELKQAGVRVLSADPEDHSDDESSWGELIRYLKGKASEDEVNNIRYRTMGGRRAKATGDPERGIAPSIVGNGQRLYGYKFILNEEGKRVGLELNYDIIQAKNDNAEWTEVKVVIFIYESLASGTPARTVAKILNEKGIPSPYKAKAVKSRKMKEDAGWHPISVSRIVKHPAYSLGEHHQFKTMVIAKMSGKRHAQRGKAPEEQHVIVTVPTIVTRELAESAQTKLAQNKQTATRNNRNPKQSLLRAGLARCGYCGCKLRVYPKTEIKNGVEKVYASYNCNKPYNSVGKCPGCSIAVPTLDNAAWSKAVEIINNPVLIDEWVKSLKSDDPTKGRRKILEEKLKEITDEQEAMRENLAILMKTKRPDLGTIEYLNGQLHQLAEKEEEASIQLSNDKDKYLIWKAVDKKVDLLHEECTEIREKMLDPNYEAPYDRKREILEFLGIQITVWKKDHKPRFQIQFKPTEIVKLLS